MLTVSRARPNEIAEIALVEAQRDDDPGIVGDAVVRREIEKRMGNAGGRTLVEQFFDASPEPAEAQAHQLRDLVSEGRRLLHHLQQEIPIQRT